MLTDRNAEKKDFDKEAGVWDEKPRRTKLAHDIASTLTKEIDLTPEMDIMDFGCGTGLLTLHLHQQVHSVTGVDSSQGMLDQLQTKIREQNLTNITTRHLDLDKGDVLTGTYHLVVSSMTFHHVQHIRPLLDQFYAVTAPSGIVCVADLDSDDGQFHSDNKGVFHFGFDREKMRRAFLESGFTDVRCTTAAKVERRAAGGDMQSFTVFLMIGRKGSSNAQ